MAQTKEIPTFRLWKFIAGAVQCIGMLFTLVGFFSLFANIGTPWFILVGVILYLVGMVMGAKLSIEITPRGQ